MSGGLGEYYNAYFLTDSRVSCAMSFHQLECMPIPFTAERSSVLPGIGGQVQILQWLQYNKNPEL